MKLKVYISDGAIQFFDHNEDAIPDPTDTFFRAVPVGALTIATTQQQDYVVFSQSNNNGGEPTVIRAVAITDVIDEGDSAYSDISDIISDLMPTIGGGGGSFSAPNIATYEMGIDISNSFFPVRILTVFNPTTNVPTRSFFQLDGTTPYVSPTSPANIVTADYILTSINSNIEIANSNIGVIRENSDNIRVELGLDAVVGDTLPQQVFVTTKSTGSHTASYPKTRKIKIIALTGTFNIGGVTFPFTTPSGVVVAEFSVEATNTRSVNFTYEVDAASTVVEVTLVG